MLCLAAAFPGVSHAGTYTLTSCKTLDGKPTIADGWGPSANPSAGYGGFSNTCLGGGSLNVNIDGAVAHPNGDQAAMRFQLNAAGLVMRSASLWRYARVDDAGPYAVWVSYISAPDATYGSGSIIDRQYGGGTLGLPGSPLAAANRIEVPADRGGTPDATINASVFCATQGGYSCNAGIGLDIYAAQIKIDDVAPPVVTATSGDLVGDKNMLTGQIAGIKTVVVAATDVGSGLRRAVVTVDGQDVAEGSYGTNNGRCVPVGGAYSYRQPCSPTGAASVTWDTSNVPDGQHKVEVFAEDASGTRTVASSGTILVKNATQTGPGSPEIFRGPPNGTAATDEALMSLVWPETAKAPRKSKRIINNCIKRPVYKAKHPVWCNGAPPVNQIRSTWSKSKSRVLAGRLTTPSGVPIANAAVDLVTTSVMQGAGPVPLATLTTDADGRFTANIARSAGSMSVTANWRARQGDTVAVAGAAATSTVKAATGLTGPKAVRRGSRVRFAGTLRSQGGNLSKVPITIQLRQDGRWKNVGNARTGARGKWRLNAPFASRPGRYPVRAIVGTTVAYPWAAGTSTRTIRVRVR